MNKVKSFKISKWEVWRAYELVKANKGSAGIDEESIQDFEQDLENNLYKIWNRMSSGSYFPPPVKTVAIAKKTGGERQLGIPTVGDRIAQMVVKLRLESKIDAIFHVDSYGYRPKKSALEAVGKARVRCWKNNWVVDLDIKGFFDNLDHDLVMKAVKKHTEEKWILLYVERWLKAPSIDKEGELSSRTKGTPQGGVISPLLANLFLHYAFDEWMSRELKGIKFERYADDIVIHCVSLKQAQFILDTVTKRLKECNLDVHPEKSKIVYCKVTRRNKRLGFATSFDFLGFTFKRRTARSKEGSVFDGFLPAISKEAKNRISKHINSWRLGTCTEKSINELSKDYNSKLLGWLNYYGRYYKTAMNFISQQMRFQLAKWARRKYKKIKSRRKAEKLIRQIRENEPNLFAHWKLLY